VCNGLGDPSLIAFIEHYFASISLRLSLMEKSKFDFIQPKEDFVFQLVRASAHGVSALKLGDMDDK